MAYRFREEVLNVLLAELLQERGLVSVPETIRKGLGPTRQLPDLIVADLLGLRLVIEGRFGTSSQVRSSLEKDALERVESGLSPICLAILYPKELRTSESLRELRVSMSESNFKVRMFSEVSGGDWAEVDLEGITELLRRAYELLISDSVVLECVDELESAIDFAAEILYSRALGERFYAVLGIPEPKDEVLDNGDTE